tara:strand:+ start:1026 stop:1523 length:498 start_codon:yes stop_codon:yes gene_type:complete
MSEYNNPANIEMGQGYAGETGETYANERTRPFVVFDSPQMGIRALARDLSTKSKRFNGDVYKMLAQFAPDFENPTHNYTKHVVNRLGGKTKIEDDNDIRNMMVGIIEFENGIDSELSQKYLQKDVFDEGFALSKTSMDSHYGLEMARIVHNNTIHVANYLAKITE